jgi:quercetin dioxygenase-like cupin family protein
MKRRIVSWALAGAVLAPLGLAASAAIAPAAAKMPQGYPAKILLSTGKTVVGETIHYPTNGPAQVTAEIVTIAPGGKTIVHHHGVPLFAYILDGEVTVDYRDHGQRTYRKGDAFLEAMAVPHQGINNGTAPVRILAVYMGVKGAQTVIPDKAR